MSNPPPQGPASRIASFEVRIRNHPGALAHLVGLFARRACNIETIVCVPSAGADTSRVWISAGPVERPAQMEQFVANLEDVVSVRLLPHGAVARFAGRVDQHMRSQSPDRMQAPSR